MRFPSAHKGPPNTEHWEQPKLHCEPNLQKKVNCASPSDSHEQGPHRLEDGVPYKMHLRWLWSTCRCKNGIRDHLFLLASPLSTKRHTTKDTEVWGITHEEHCSDGASCPPVPGEMRARKSRRAADLKRPEPAPPGRTQPAAQPRSFERSCDSHACPEQPVTNIVHPHS